MSDSFAADAATYHPQTPEAKKVGRDKFGDPKVSWFHREMSGKEAMIYLNNAGAGAFVIRRPPETLAYAGPEDMCLSVQAGSQIANVLLKNMPGPDNGSFQIADSYFMFNPLHMFVDVVDLVEYATDHPFNFPTLENSVYVKLSSRAAQDAEKENAKREKQEAKDAKKAEAEREKSEKKAELVRRKSVKDARKHMTKEEREADEIAQQIAALNAEVMSDEEQDHLAAADAKISGWDNSFFDTEPALERKQSYTRAPARKPSAVLQISEKEEAGELKKSKRNVFTEEQKNVGADPTRNIGEIGSTFKKEENAPAPWASLVKLKSSTSKVGAGLKRWTASAKKVDEEAPLGFN